ncbi:oxygenase MpaB family protein [Kineococcus sp. SYSU DK002]|uniref:oxygenase MpaB family protein n=1 Tax=Kineococcus sp. SYSU DK002 TaxID=3383123 RepID=UPI003D7E6A6A
MNLDEAPFHGDPLADALAEAVHADPALRAGLSTALRDGSRTAPSPVREFVADLERVADAADPDLLRAGARATFTTPQAVHVFDVGAGALISSYRPPQTATILVGTGRLVGSAHLRLTDTARWLTAASLPGGLVRGAPGWRVTAHVRLGHALVRRAVRQAGPHTPISQFDSLRTWLDFTVVAPRSAHRLGFGVTDAEYAQFLDHWRVLGELLGVHPDLLAPAVDRPSAVALLAEVDARTGPPNEDSRTLTAAGLDALATGLADLTPVPHRVGLVAARAVARRLQGEQADALGVPPVGGWERLVPVVASVAGAYRALLRRRPAAWERMVERNVAANREFLAQSG